MRSTILAALTALIATTASAADVADTSHVRAACARKWSTDFSMQSYCVEKQLEAMLAFTGHAATLSEAGLETQPRKAVALANCSAKWATAMKADYSMALYCYEQQVEAIRVLEAAEGE